MIDVAPSWGRYPAARQRIVDLHEMRVPALAPEETCLPRGQGRSYGDSCLNDGGVLLSTRRLDRFFAFDPVTGVVECESGVILRDLLELVLPRGWFLAVTPGTQFVTVGGAIANDVHGKNHHRAGSFGNHVLDFDLHRSDGAVLRCAADENPEWFAATVGGLGLTGLIGRVRLQLRPVPGPWLALEYQRFDTLDEFFTLSTADDPRFEYTVAWLDCLDMRGRGLFCRGNHVASQAPARPPVRLALPFTPPFALVNSLTLRAFNSLYWRWPRKNGPGHYQPFFYPLDRIARWNLLYGPAGFVQYQCVLPPAAAARGVAEMLRQIARSGQGSFLAVLKNFGEVPSRGLLSFARPGTTLALDFPLRGSRTFALLDCLDAITMEAGGAVYPAKDARMSGAAFRQYFPRWEKMQPFQDPAFSSSFWRRIQA
jgi:FAD/FMN-containing dehydrogenase